MRYRGSLICDALLDASRLLNGRVHPADEVIQILKPFFDCTGVEDARGPQHETGLRSMIFMLAADAYRREGSVREAAILYRHAFSIAPGTQVPKYVQLVCEHRLNDFYPDAFKLLQEHRRRWFAKPFVVRIVLRFLAWQTWVGKERWKLARSEKEHLRFLAANLPWAT